MSAAAGSLEIKVAELIERELTDLNSESSGCTAFNVNKEWF